MNRESKTKVDSLGFEPWSSLGKVDLIPIPSKEMLNYVIEQDTLNFKGLALHIVTTLVVADRLIQAIEEANKIKPDKEQLKISPQVTLETMVAYHASRPLAEAGAKQKAGETINQYMKTRDDIDLAVLVGVQEHLPFSIIMAIEELQKSRGAPNKTIGPENPFHPGKIDWTVALTQISSWLVDGGIVTMEERFEDLITRHAGIKNSPKKFSKEELVALRDWGLKRLDDLCIHIGIERQNFMGWLRVEVQSNLDTVEAKRKSDELIRELFSREPREGEFLPTTPAYRYIAKGLMSIEPSEVKRINGKEVVVKRKRRKWLETIFSRPERFLRLCTQFGLIDSIGGNYNTIAKS